jgi:hypothetical protein
MRVWETALRKLVLSLAGVAGLGGLTMMLVTCVDVVLSTFAIRSMWAG